MQNIQMTGSNNGFLREWVGKVEEQLDLLRDIDLGYPQGRNEIIFRDRPFDAEQFCDQVGLSHDSQVCAFYGLCDGLVWSDVHVGYFLHSSDRVIKALSDGEPTAISGPLATQILVVGSDGGGGRFAVRRDGSNEVLYLPVGAVHDAVFQGERTPVRVVSPDFFSFLERLRQDLVAFVGDDADWQFISR